MSIEAMKQALEALECINSPLQVCEINKIGGAMNALREAIEFQEMVEKGTKAWADTPDDWVDDLRGGVEAEQQEPVCETEVEWDASAPLVMTPHPAFQKREWVGLTDEDIDLYAFDEGVTDNKAPAWLVTYARAVEAKLREKNNAA